MEYGDEEIIRRRLLASAKKSHSINNKITIDGVEYTFAPREFEFGFSMVVPESFDILAPEYAKRKFPHEDRPKIMISSSDTTICLAFNGGDRRNETLEERIQIYRTCVKRLHPSNVFFYENIYCIVDDFYVACYDYRSAAIDDDLYNLSFFADLPDYELFGWFTCAAELQSKWEPLIRQMIQTIHVVSVDGR